MTPIPDFHEEMNRFQNHIPTWVGHNLNRLRGKRAIWVRVLTGVALIVAWGFLPLPVVGIWMLPVGLALLAHDIPMVRAPIARLLHFTNRKIEKKKSEYYLKLDDLFGLIPLGGCRADSPASRLVRTAKLTSQALP